MVTAWSTWISPTAGVIHDWPIPTFSGSGIGDQWAMSSTRIVRVGFGPSSPPLAYT
jgi:hypothetical protein